MENLISKKICEFRKARSLTQEQLGAKLGISGQAISKWEKGETLPDIMILPKLCEIFGVSVDALLEVPVSIKNKNIMHDFCAYARENGKDKTMIEALSRLYSDSGNQMSGSAVDFSSKSLRIYDKNGMGFVIDNHDYIESCLDTKGEDVSFILRILTDETCMSVLKLISIDKAMTKEEISEITKLDEETVNRILLGLMKRHMVTCDLDPSGKRGYLQDTGMCGIYMILAGCKTLNHGGALLGSLWFTRQ